MEELGNSMAGTPASARHVGNHFVLLRKRIRNPSIDMRFQHVQRH